MRAIPHRRKLLLSVEPLWQAGTAGFSWTQKYRFLFCSASMSSAHAFHVGSVLSATDTWSNRRVIWLRLRKQLFFLHHLCADALCYLAPIISPPLLLLSLPTSLLFLSSSWKLFQNRVSFTLLHYDSCIGDIVVIVAGKAFHHPRRT